MFAPMMMIIAYHAFSVQHNGFQMTIKKRELYVIHMKFMDLSASFLLLQSKQIMKPNQKLIMH